MRRIQVHFSFPWPLTSTETREIINFAFQTSLLSYVGFVVLENLQPGFVSMYYNLNHLLWMTIGLALVTVLWPAIIPDKTSRRTNGPRHYLGLGLTAGIAGAIVWYQVRSIGDAALVVALLSALAVFGIGLLVFRDE